MQTTSKQEKKVRDALDSNYSYLAGNAIGRDKKGRAIKDNSADMQAAGHNDSEYSAYVCYDFEIN
jgi:V-type H+-transporting ATPase subunit C